MAMIEAAIGALTVRQEEYTKSRKAPRKYDLRIAGLSWESRATAASASLSGELPAFDLLKFRSKTDEVEAKKEKLN